jgi:hypothetical protein
MLLVALLSACSSSPKQIASYPKQPADGPKLISPAVEVVYNASLAMTVSNVERAARRAEELAYNYGGYMVSSQTWHQDNQRYTSVVLAVPVPNYDTLHSALLDLGALASETVTGQLVSYAPGGQTNYSYITVSFSPRGFAWPSLSLPAWNPIRTIQNALGVFLTLCGYAFNTLIWLGIVGGPFFLLLVGAWTIIRKLSS